MAFETAIATTSATIIGLLRDRCPRDDLTNPDFQLYHPSNFDAPMNEGFSVLLYRVARNPTLRNQPPRRTPDGRTLQPAIPLDLHYLLTPWAKDPLLQQRLLGWAVRFFEDMPVLPAAALTTYDTAPDHDSFAANESVELVLETLPLADLWALWDKLKPKMQASLAYVARVVAIDSRRPLVEAEPVQSRDFRVGTPAIA